MCDLFVATGIKGLINCVNNLVVSDDRFYFEITN